MNLQFLYPALSGLKLHLMSQQSDALLSSAYNSENIVQAKHFTTTK